MLGGAILSSSPLPQSCNQSSPALSNLLVLYLAELHQRPLLLNIRRYFRVCDVQIVYSLVSKYNGHYLFRKF